MNTDTQAHQILQSVTDLYRSGKASIALHLLDDRLIVYVRGEHRLIDSCDLDNGECLAALIKQLETFK